MRDRYGSIDVLNRAWDTSYARFEDVSTFLPEKAPGDRSRADLVEWYQQAMTDWCVFWVRAAAGVPEGGDLSLHRWGRQSHAGRRLTAQTMAIAPFGAGVRMHQRGSSYLHNYTLTRQVATATRHAGTFCGFEPAAKVDAGGVVARIYNATASGARQLHDYAPNTLGDDPAALRQLPRECQLPRPEAPRIDVALYLSRETWAFDPGAINRGYALSRVLRDAADHDFLTRRSVADGRLSAYRTLILAESPVLEPKAAEAIEAWVRKGGTLIAVERSGDVLGKRLYDNGPWHSRLFVDHAPSIDPVRSTLAGTADAMGPECRERGGRALAQRDLAWS